MQIYQLLKLFLLFLLQGTYTWAQCPQPSFTIPDTICINEPLTITNTSTDATRYEWDFCSGDLEQKPSITELSTVTGASVPTNITTVFDGSNWVGFFFSRENNLLFRLNFGSSLNNSPSVVNVGNLGSIINKPEPVKFVKEGANWYALGTNFSGNFNLFRLNFGTSLFNTPTVTDLTNLSGSLNRPRGIEILSDKGDHVAVITNAGDNTLVIIKFGNSILNSISASNILKTASFSGTGHHLTSTSIINDCDKWYGVTVSVLSNSIFTLNFGSNIFSIPSITNITSNLPLIPSPFIVTLAEEEEYYGFIQTDGGDLIQLNFGASMTNTQPAYRNMGGSLIQNGIAGFSLKKMNSISQWVGFSISYNNNKLYRFNFPNICPADISFSDKIQPDVIKYSAGGNHKITLRSYNAADEAKSLTKSVYVRPQLTADFTAVGSPPSFTAQMVSGQRISSWNWDFEDGTTGTGRTIQHDFSSDGLFNITLTVTDICGNTAVTSKQIGIVNNTVLACPQASFGVPDTICINEVLPLSNNSAGATRYEWDFCNNGLTKQPEWSTDNITLTGAVTPIDIETVFADNQWHSFICSRDNDKLIRLDYGNSLSNTPVIVDLGNTGGLLKSPNGIKFRKEGNTWYALLVNVTGNISNNLVKLNFGNSLTNIPTVSNVGNVSEILTNPRAIDLVEDKGNVIAIIPNYGANTVTLVNFGNSIDNNPTPAQILNLTGFSTNSGLWDVVLKKNCNQWYGFVIGYNSAFYRLDFGENLFSTATIITLNDSVKDISSIAELDIQQEQGDYYGFIITQLGRFYRLDLGKNLNNNQPSVVQLTTEGQFNDADGFELVKDGPSVKINVIDWGENKLKRASFSVTCATPVATSTDVNPSNIEYTQEGMQKITLTAYDAYGNIDITIDSVFVRPDIHAEFTFDKACEKEAVQFFSPALSAGNYITSWVWDFGDGSSSNQQNPAHQFTTAGVKNVSLTVTDVCNKIVSISKSIVIYQDSTPDFIAPAEICSNELVTFQDASTIVDDTILSWNWSFGNGETATGKNPDFTYKDPGSFTVILTITGKSGCAFSVAKTLNVKAGTKVDFSVQNACLGNQTAFSDLSQFPEGTSFVSRIWQFGDGETSILSDPVHEYKTTGMYTVKLTVENNIGCSVTFTKMVEVTRLPEPAFSYSLSCSGEQTGFFDESIAPDGEIVAWQWDFGDSSGGSNSISTERNTSYIFASSGTYQVKLTVQTLSGCSSSVTQTIQVVESPQSNFTHTLNCVSKQVAFTDQTVTSGSNNITNWYWDFGDGSNSLEQNPVHTYQEIGTYTVTLITTASSRCTNTFSRQINVTGEPTADFKITGELCANSTLTFTDISSPSLTDSIVSRQWDFGIFGKSSELQPAITFNSTNGVSLTVPVTLTVTTLAGCSAVIAKEVVLNSSPRTDFEYAVVSELTPLQINFINKSGPEAVKYLWNFGDGMQSDQKEVAHTYDKPGTYIVSLTTTNANGCSYTVNKELIISNVPDIFELKLEFIEAGVSNNNINIIAYVQNNSTIEIKNIEFITLIEDRNSSSNSWTGALLPGENLNYSYQIPYAESPVLPASLCVYGRDKATLKVSNRQCLATDNQFAVLNPFPNPANRQITLPVIVPVQTNIQIEIIDILGKHIHSIESNLLNVGFNEIMLDFEKIKLGAGMYIIQYNLKGNILSRKIVIQ